MSGGFPLSNANSGNTQGLEERIRTLETRVKQHIENAAIHKVASGNIEYTFDAAGRETRRTTYTNASKNVRLSDEYSTWTPAGYVPEQLLSTRKVFYFSSRTVTYETLYAYNMSGNLIGENTREV